MTKKHFKLFAEGLANVENDELRREMTVFISAILKQDNELFDLERFNEYIRRLRAGEDLKGLR